MFQLRRQTRRWSARSVGVENTGRAKVRGRRIALGRRQDVRGQGTLPRVPATGRVDHKEHRRQGRGRVQVSGRFQNVAHPKLQSQLDRHT